MRITITCEDCGRRHRLERTIEEPGPIWIVCHGCETPLRAELEPQHVPAPAAPAATTVDPGFVGAWGGILDVTPLEPGVA